VITTYASRPLNLNDTLSKNGCMTNTFRDGSVYKSNPKFWMTRPLTQMMINWACEDVVNLFLLQSRQVVAAMNETLCKSASEEALTIHDKVHALVEVPNVGRFIGRNGSNIKSLTRFLKPHSAEFQRVNFVVYANDEKALEIVKACVCKAGANYTNNYNNYDY
jgi:hypothetical protein